MPCPESGKGCMNKRSVGTAYEKKAVSFLEKQGLEILCCNFRNRYGEIDIVAKDGRATVFVEVKYRRDNDKGTPEEAVDFRKQRRICRVADYYRYTHGLGDSTAVRYDVVAVQGEKIEWLQNAFPHVYAGNH